jgi:hypothetical protein
VLGDVHPKSLVASLIPNCTRAWKLCDGILLKEFFAIFISLVVGTNINFIQLDTTSKALFSYTLIHFNPHVFWWIDRDEKLVNNFPPPIHLVIHT